MRHAVMIGSRRLACYEAGSPAGRALVLLHAFPLTSAMWRPQLDAQPAGWRVIAPDFAGLGDSDDHDVATVAFDDYPRDIVAMLDRLGVRQAVLCGLSLGGYVALAVARIAPERVRGLVLADTKAAADSVQAREGRTRLLDVLSERGVDGVADEMIPKLLGETTRRQRPALAGDVRSIILTNDPEGIRRAILRLMHRPDATPGLSKIDAPTLVLAGAEDVVTPPSDAEALAGAIRGASLQTIDAAGHLSSLEQPAAFNGALDAFLQQLR